MTRVNEFDPKTFKPKRTTYYDKNGKVTSIATYDKNGNLEETQIFDPNSGKLVQIVDLNPNTGEVDTIWNPDPSNPGHFLPTIASVQP